MIDRILIVDDEFLIRQLLEETATRRDVETVTAGSGEEAIEILKKEEFQMAFVDLKMGKVGGMDVLRFCSENKPEILFVIMTAYGTIETAVEAMKLGAFDFVIKPFSPDQMDVIVEKGARWFKMNERQHYFQHEIVTRKEGHQIKAIGDSRQIREINRLIDRVAPTDATVLVTGESGTGKELVASEIHRISNPTGNRPYIRMNCAAVPETLLESELFGHEKGAFTGAAERRVGRFELADGGTLLLDEIGEINKGMQAKLLRVLQESEFERVGGAKTISVNVRVIATTNRDLKKAVADGDFREDLFYRLNVFPIHLPPLREREDDAVAIASHFLAGQSEKLRRELRLADDAVALIRSYSWPGNIRELENVIERVAILEDGPAIGAEAFPSDMTGSGFPPRLDADDDAPTLNLAEIERRTIIQALKRTSGNRTKAADMLGFSVRTLRNKLNEYVEKSKLDQDALALISNEN